MGSLPVPLLSFCFNYGMMDNYYLTDIQVKYGQGKNFEFYVIIQYFITINTVTIYMMYILV
jgi:hypothetical protein